MFEYINQVNSITSRTFLILKYIYLENKKKKHNNWQIAFWLNVDVDIEIEEDRQNNERDIEIEPVR